MGIGLEHHLQAALPHLSTRAQRVVHVIQCGTSRTVTSRRVAALLGLPSRFALGRMLRREGLPGVRELASWLDVLAWVILAERSSTPLFVIATRSHRSPAVCYRMVKRLTGLTWVALRARGSQWVLRLFIDRCQEIGCALAADEQRHRVPEDLKRISSAESKAAILNPGHQDTTML